ncbi:MAG TPA: DUF998 domain-containing protein [Thermomicrobiales bacterium]|nr:DUF998 domain-containing protein [Thermomicrobiales bacterium]
MMRPLAAIGLFGIALNGVALVAAPMLRSDVDPIATGLSYYAVGPWSGIAIAAFVALGVACIAIALALVAALRGSRLIALGAWLLGLSGLGCIGLAAFPMGQPGPTTPIGDLHLTAGTLAVTLQLTALVALNAGFAAEPGWRALFRAGWLLGGLAAIGAALQQIAIWRPDLPMPEGVSMRLVLVPLLAWWGVIALRLLHMPPPAAPKRAAT